MTLYKTIQTDFEESEQKARRCKQIEHYLFVGRFKKLQRIADTEKQLVLRVLTNLGQQPRAKVWMDKINEEQLGISLSDLNYEINKDKLDIGLQAWIDSTPKVNDDLLIKSHDLAVSPNGLQVKIISKYHTRQQLNELKLLSSEELLGDMLALSSGKAIVTTLTAVIDIHLRLPLRLKSSLYTIGIN